METFVQVAVLSLIALFLVAFFWVIAMFICNGAKGDDYGPEEQGAGRLDDVLPEDTAGWEALPFGVTCRILYQMIDCERGKWDWYITLRWMEEDEYLEQTFLIPNAVMSEESPAFGAILPNFADKCIVFEKVPETKLHYVVFKVFPCP
ncbi:MAG: hypothetical protein AMXMBFR44_2600 [Candidatus Campbellbacteria bacterium]